MSLCFIAKRRSPPKYAFTVWHGPEMTDAEKEQFDKVVLQDQKYSSENSIKTWYDIYEIDGEYYGIGRTKGHTIYLQDFMKCYCNDYEDFHRQIMNKQP